MKERGFGDYLVKQGVLHAEGLRQALAAQASAEGRLDTVLLDLGLVGEQPLLEALGRHHSTRTVSAAELAAASPEAARMVSPRVASRLEVVPFRIDGRTLSVATLNPGDLLIEDEIGLLTGCMVSSFVTLEVRLYEAMSRVYGVTLSIQMISVLNRLEGQAPIIEPVAAAPAGPQPAPAEDSHAVRRAPPPTTARPTRDGRAFPRQPDDSMVLEITQDELDEFPSLRQGVDAGRYPAATLDGRPAGGPRPLSVDERLDAASVAMSNAEMREEIGDALLEFCEPYFQRRLLLALRHGTVMGWRGAGVGINQEAVREVEISLEQPSVFVGLTQGSEFWLGPLAAMRGNQELVRVLGGVAPSECMVLPLIAGGRPLGFVYGDNRNNGVTEVPVAHLRRLVAKAGLAFQVYLLKGKIRTL
jgi:hypothetical protein